MLGVVAIVVAGLAIGGYQVWQREQTYQTGHAAYLEGDCPRAVGPLRTVAESESGSGASDTTLKAAEELGECEALLEAADLGTAGEPAEAVLAFRDFAEKYPQSPLADHAVRRAGDLLAADPAAAASIELCDALPDLETQEFIATPADTIPPLLYACGAAYEDDDSFAEALASYARFRSEFPDHELAGDVEDAFARAAIADAEAADAGEIEAPVPVEEGGDETQATVAIQNGTTDVLLLVFSGPDTRIEELEACGACAGQPATDVCDVDGPTADYLVAPGTYQVVVRSGSGADVLPFRGTWELEAGQVYASCFYISRL